jgi:hypothetical protein
MVGSMVLAVLVCACLFSTGVFSRTCPRAGASTKDAVHRVPMHDRRGGSCIAARKPGLTTNRHAVAMAAAERKQ